MITMMRPGRIDEIHASSGKWIVLDIGFANRARSCGLLLHDHSPDEVQFAEAMRRISLFLSAESGPFNLLIEAPLSVAFDRHGNPKGKRVERQGNVTRYWYVGLGCSVMVATLYLVKKVVEENPDADIRLFEGFVSYHEARNRANHCADVLLLREVVDDPKKYADAIIPRRSLKTDETDILYSAFLIAGADGGVPPVIMRNG
jgi:hypothetical protein